MDPYFGLGNYGYQMDVIDANRGTLIVAMGIPRILY